MISFLRFSPINAKVHRDWLNAIRSLFSMGGGRAGGKEYHDLFFQTGLKCKCFLLFLQGALGRVLQFTRFPGALWVEFRWGQPQQLLSPPCRYQKIFPLFRIGLGSSRVCYSMMWLQHIAMHVAVARGRGNACVYFLWNIKCWSSNRDQSELPFYLLAEGPTGREWTLWNPLPNFSQYWPGK